MMKVERHFELPTYLYDGKWQLEMHGSIHFSIALLTNYFDMLCVGLTGVSFK